ncbi:MAG: four helix bundle protein [Candidatus Sungbacteria bacterium]|nr:four helix bundle protein [Candidatus Sungbacteria bacterium]
MRNLQQLETDAPILQKTIELYKEFYGYLKMFPKKDQYLLGKRCEDTILEFTEYVVMAANSSKDRKLRLLEVANGKFDLFKVLLRVAREFKMLDNKKYLSLEAKTQEIGRMLGGWIRSLMTKTP